LDNVDSVICEVRNGAGWIRLNRPRAINSLRADMVERMLDQLNRWKDDPDVALVCLEGEGEKGFCAGGDMRALYDLRNGGIEEYALRFFVAEYRMDHLIHRYPKPVAAFMNGVVMGGGVGLSIGASHRFVTDTTRWAMPEMNIGFFPDVGASYFLNRFPGFVGRYLALTSHTIGVGDTIYLNAADCAVEPDRWEALKREFAGRMWTADTAREDFENAYAGVFPKRNAAVAAVVVAAADRPAFLPRHSGRNRSVAAGGGESRGRMGAANAGNAAVESAAVA